MAELLVELFSEEIPARMQKLAADDLLKLLTGKLDKAQLAHAGPRSFVTLRRITLHATGLPQAQPNISEVRRGPRVGAPDQAVQGVLKSARLAPPPPVPPHDTIHGSLSVPRSAPKSLPT